MNIHVISSHIPSLVSILISVLKYTFVNVYINWCFKKTQDHLVDSHREHIIPNNKCA